MGTCGEGKGRGVRAGLLSEASPLCEASLLSEATAAPPRSPQPPPHQGELDTEREGLSVSQALDDHDDRRGHGLSQLVGADGVALEGEVGEDDEAAEAEGQRQHLGGLEALGGEGAESLAQVKAEPGDGEVDQGEAEVGETQPHVQPLV